MSKNRSTPPTDEQVKARVLTSCQLGESNDVITLALSDARAAATEGLVDIDPAAVAYAESLDGPAESAPAA